MRIREQQMRGQARYADAAPGEVRAAAVRRERVESMMRTAALMYQQEIRGRALVNRYLRQTGMTGQQLADTTAEIVAIQERQGETLNQEAEGLVAANGPFGILGRDMPNATRDAITQLGQLSEILSNINASQPGAEGEGGEAVTTAEDAYVRRGGIMGVSSGDLVVSRRHLADAITARRGALAGPAAGMASQGGMAGPQPSTIGGGGGELAITVPVVIDGREVARAVGRANIQQLERGGGNIAPGQRRSLRETGFGRSV
jgi:hypothetical protein